MLILLLLPYFLFQSTTTCPSSCTCKHDIVDCSGNFLDKIPAGIPLKTRILNVTRNRLQHLSDDSFYGLFELQEIYLQDNIITVVYENTFETNRQLRFLNMRNNNLRELPENLFGNNIYLRQIDIRNNPSLTFISYKMIEHLRHFHSLKANNVDCGCDMIEWYKNMQLLRDKGLQIDITCTNPQVNIQNVVNHNMIEICSSKLYMPSCAHGEAMCENGACITDDLWCDGNYDCLDRSDELSCTTDPPLESCESLEEYLLCDDGRKCIPNEWVCDGFEDCADASDEQNNECTTYTRRCSNGEFECKNNRCITAALECNGVNDCGDWSDESKLVCGELEAPDVCAPGMALCPFGGGCIHHSNICDGEIDCHGGTDERDCFGNCTSFCLSDRRCIEDRWVCDGVPDCPDYSDEINCEYECGTDEVKCGGCLACQFICDGVIDCYDGKDEQSCAICTSSICLGSPQTIVIIVCVVSACFFIGSTALFIFLYRRKKCSSDTSDASSAGSVREDGPPLYNEIDTHFHPHSPPPRYKSEPDIATRVVSPTAPALYPQQDI